MAECFAHAPPEPEGPLRSAVQDEGQGGWDRCCASLAPRPRPGRSRRLAALLAAAGPRGARATARWAAPGGPLILRRFAPGEDRALVPRSAAAAADAGQAAHRLRPAPRNPHALPGADAGRDSCRRAARVAPDVGRAPRPRGPARPRPAPVRRPVVAGADGLPYLTASPTSTCSGGSPDPCRTPSSASSRPSPRRRRCASTARSSCPTAARGAVARMAECRNRGGDVLVKHATDRLETRAVAARARAREAA